ncbi:hypothetical protein NA57DRAFT_81320 [Rhizodiscina lignyota]|uniref:Arrestin-like N-terminal domain-containing protein n=1 Tax=Rhizodiscina lignyota TaxID=1504668 RepID=A0A9P4I7C7_9PEZI|nr:hypothetical protein NA57DRAFT_81320 [Rhizodiscina lignyota]
MFNVEIENQAWLYFPGDRFTGVVILEAAVSLDISTITIKFHGKSKTKVATETESGWNVQKIFEQSRTLYSRDKYAGEPPLSAGTHKWSFTFQFPQHLACYPPRFLFIPSERRRIAWVVYEVKAYVDGTGIKDTAKAKLVFWPSRRTRLENGPMPVEFRKPLIFPVPPAKSRQISKVALLLKRASKKVECSVTLFIPRFAILSEPISLQISFDWNNNLVDDENTTLSQARLTAIRIRLYSITGIGYKTPHTLSSQSPIKTASYTDMSIPISKGRVNLHDLLPAPFVINAEPYKGMDMSGCQDNPFSLGPLCPSFETPMISRTYRLEISGTIFCAGKYRGFHVQSGEIVLLSHVLHRDFAMKDDALVEMDHAAERERAEVMGQDVLEIDGIQQTLEIPTAGNEVLELETPLPELNG